MVCIRSRAFRSAATVGCDPAVMGIGPIPATRKVLARAGLKVDALDVVEINEAFRLAGARLHPGIRS